MDALIVRGQPDQSDAVLTAGSRQFPAKIGRTGLIPPGGQKTEGDGRTPVGRFALRTLYWRADRRGKPVTGLPAIPLTPETLWCDDAQHALYNRPVTAPFAASHEKMWMEARTYDVCIVLDYNLVRPRPGAGSAIFFHLTNGDDGPGPTEGCVAITPTAMDLIVGQFSPQTVLDIGYTE